MKQCFKRVLSCTLVVAMLVLCLPLTAFAAYENTHVNTGDQAADIVAVAETQVGYLEGSLAGTTAGSNNYTKYGVWYDNYTNQSGFSYGAWCAMFVSWCAYQAGIPSDTVYYHAYCPYGVNWWQNKGQWQYSASRGGSYTPQPGDIIYFAPSGSTESSHVGLVRYASGGYVYTVEGNTSGQNGEVNEGGGCFLKSYSLSYSRIYGYGTPAYEEGTGTTAQKLGTYKVTASSLNVRSGAGTGYDIVTTLSTGELVTVSQIQSDGWGYITTKAGTSGWAAIGTYGDYIGVDALNTELAAAWSGEFLSMTTNTDGSVTFTNTNTDQIAVDMPLANPIGNRTTPYLNIGITPHTGGYYFGLTQSGSGYFMMRDCQSGDELVNENSAPYMTGTETLQIDIGYWWAPEASYQIDTVRLYLEAGASVTVNYCYFADEADVVTSAAYNMRVGSGSTDTDPVVVPDPINLMNPNTLSIPDRTKTGSYSYQNGVLTVVSGETNGYEVSMDLNVSYTPEELSRWLISVDANVRFDIELLVTTSDGERIFSLCDDFNGEFGGADGDYVPAMSGSAGLGILGCYTWNNVLPADGVSTVKTVTFRVGGVGTLVVNSCQLAANDSLTLFTDTVSVSDSTPDVTPEPDPDPAVLGDVNGDGSVTTVDARMILSYLLGSTTLTDEQLTIADYDGNGTVSTTDVRAMLVMLLN